MDRNMDRSGNWVIALSIIESVKSVKYVKSVKSVELSGEDQEYQIIVIEREESVQPSDIFDLLIA